MNHGVDAAGAQGGHRGWHVAGEVDGVVGTEVAEVGIVLTWPRGGDHIRSAGRGELHGEPPDAAGGA